jgi:signal transduction histidine kinase
LVSAFGAFACLLTESLTKVVDSAKHLLNLINDVLDMSKIESGSLNLFVEENINLNEIITHATETTQALLLDKPVTMYMEVETLPLVKGDRQRILQILLNILSNACKFTEEGSITFRAKTQGDEICLSVTDTGPGISLEDQAKVFEPFKQTQTGIRQGSGTGLGMPISKSLAEAHHGRLWLESTVGKGTTFYVALPIASEALPVS